MRKEIIFDHFVRKFPEYANRMVDYRKTGSKMIRITLDDGQNLTFLYINDKNWTFGTGPWRERPKRNELAD